VLLGTRVGNHPGAVGGKGWAEIGAFPAAEPKRVSGIFGIGTSDHFEFEICGNLVEGKGWMQFKPAGTEAALLSAAEESKHDGAFGPGNGSERARQFEYGDRSRSVVIGAVINGISIHGRADAEVIQMRAQQDSVVA